MSGSLIDEDVFHAMVDRAEKAEARVSHLERSMREILMFLSTGAVNKAWKLGAAMTTPCCRVVDGRHQLTCPVLRAATANAPAPSCVVCGRHPALHTDDELDVCLNREHSDRAGSRERFERAKAEWQRVTGEDASHLRHPADVEHVLLTNVAKAAEDLAVIINTDPRGLESRPHIEVEAFRRLVTALAQCRGEAKKDR